MRREPMAVRFWRKVEKREDGCWIWLGARSLKLKKPYGMFRVNNTMTRRAHVLSYELYYGPVPEGKELDHLCRETLCVNPQHLEPVTHGENIKRGVEHGSYRNNRAHVRQRSALGTFLPEPLDIEHVQSRHSTRPEGYCSNGHKMEGDNVGTYQYGQRCRTCSREATARTRAAKREQPRELLPPPAHCKYGHAMTPENASPREWGWQCLACSREQQRRTYVKRKKAMGLTTKPRGPYKKKGA